MIKQNALTVVAAIKEGSLPALKTVLDYIDNDVEANDVIPFLKLTTIHFARFVIIDAETIGTRNYPPQLAFSTNFDGELNEHLSQFFQVSGVGFDKVFQHCTGYPIEGSASDKIAFIKKNALPPPKAFYVGHRGLTVDIIKKQNQIRNVIEAFLDQHPQEKYAHKEIRQNIISHLNEKKLLDTPAPQIKLDSPLVPLLVAVAPLILIGVAFGWCVLGSVLVLTVLLLLLWLLLIRMKELKDPEIEIVDEENLNTKIAELKGREDFVVQNQLTHLVAIKEGWLRLLTLNAVLWAINLLAKVWFNKGKLGNIPTIHFARWVMINDNKMLLFFSNFDGSWESYLGDFIDKAAVGLTGVWSNSSLFPKTKFIIYDGATDEERFKYWTRKHQIPTQVWYTAYKNLSVTNVINNNIIHQGLFGEMNEEETKQWLQKL